jgi:hypothetical protein
MSATGLGRGLGTRAALPATLRLAAGRRHTAESILRAWRQDKSLSAGAVLLLLILLTAVACRENVASPTEAAASCASITAGSQADQTTQLRIGSAGGSLEITVTAGPGCTWNATSRNPDFISVTSGAAGTGVGTVSISVSANAGAERTGTVLVGGLILTVTQAAAVPCSFSLSGDTSRPFGPGGGSGNITVTVTQGTNCSWTATSSAPFVAVTSGASGNGSGTVEFTVSANTGSARTATLTIAGQAITVTQGAGTPTCAFSLSATSQHIGADGAPGTVNVLVGDGCTWTVVSSASWLRVTSGASGSGNGSVGFAADADSGLNRVATLTISGSGAAAAVFTVNQDGVTCAFSINPTSQTLGPVVASGTVAVVMTVGSGCTWTAVSNAAWLHITAGVSGSGNGTVQFSVDENLFSSVARVGTLTIAGQIFTVNQRPYSCGPITLTPSAQTIPASGGTGTFDVTTTPECHWFAITDALWEHITAGDGNHVGSGTIGFRVDANPGPARSGTITISGTGPTSAYFTVNQ